MRSGKTSSFALLHPVIYRTRDLVPPHLIPLLTQGKVLVNNWHVFEPQSVQSGGVGGKVIKAGVPVRVKETINIGSKTTTARGSRYLTVKDYERQLAAGILVVLEEDRDKQGNLNKVKVESTRHYESDTSILNRVLGREVGGKQNILVFNDEAHHAYRIRRDEPEPGEEDEFGEMEEADEFFQEATIWIDGLDKVQKLRGINVCVDLSATPYFLGRVGLETNKPFPWVVSDFGLIDALEAGLVKIPQLIVAILCPHTSSNVSSTMSLTAHSRRIHTRTSCRTRCSEQPRWTIPPVSKSRALVKRLAFHRI
ncbi:MAG: hypothetical protein WBQ08_03860 [Candidatus Sulfotelmatobacter sp.]